MALCGKTIYMYYINYSYMETRMLVMSCTVNHGIIRSTHPRLKGYEEKAHKRDSNEIRCPSVILKEVAEIDKKLLISLCRISIRNTNNQ